MDNRKKILITGATHGIGRSVAEKFLEEGWEVYGCGSNRDDTRGRQMEDKYRRFHFQFADVSNEDDVRQLVALCGGMDAAFNNAGTGCAPKDIHVMDMETERRVLEVNLFGTALCMKYEIIAMLAEGRGTIINNSSVAAYRADTGAGALYSASKAGILRLTREAAAAKCYWDKIRFFSLVPGWVETRMTAMDDREQWKRMLPSESAVAPEQVAELVYTVIENSYAFESGQEFYISGGGYL